MKSLNNYSFDFVVNCSLLRQNQQKSSDFAIFMHNHKRQKLNFGEENVNNVQIIY